MAREEFERMRAANDNAPRSAGGDEDEAGKE